MATLQLPGVGATGGRIIGPDGAVLSAGPVTGMCDGIGPAESFAGLGPDQISYYFYSEVTHNTSAVGGPLYSRDGRHSNDLAGSTADGIRTPSGTSITASASVATG